MELKLWKITQEASIHLRTLGGWLEYVDPETRNRFYYRNELVPRAAEGLQLSSPGKDKRPRGGHVQEESTPWSGASGDTGRSKVSTPGHDTPSRGGNKRAGFSMGGDTDGDNGETEEEKEVSIDHFRWAKPEEFARDEAKLLGWASVTNHSRYIRSHAGRYNVVEDTWTGVTFYVDTSNETCSLVPPREALLSSLFECSETTGRFLGLQREWEVRVDPDGNEFFCLERMERVRKHRVTEDVVTRDLRWERPVEAVAPVDLLAGDYPGCTMEMTGFERANQPWYICQDCDREQKGAEMFRVCVACARRCHKARFGHGVRFCKLSSMRCMCSERGDGFCLFFARKEEVEARWAETKWTAIDEKAALKSEMELASISPPMLAYVPHCWPDGSLKDVCGWQICRRSAGSTAVKGWAALEDPELPRRLPVGAEVRPRSRSDAKMVVGQRHGAKGLVRAKEAGLSKGVFFWSRGRVIAMASDERYLIRIVGRATEVGGGDEREESPCRGEISNVLEWEFHKERLMMTKTPVFYYNEERGESTWAAPTPKGVSREVSPCSESGRRGSSGSGASGVVGGVRRAADERGLERRGRSGDSDASAREAVRAGYPALCLEEWKGMQRYAKTVWIRGRYTVYMDRETASLFYHDEIASAREKVALALQRRWRRRMKSQGLLERDSSSRGGDGVVTVTRRRRTPTEAYSFVPPEELVESMMLCTAWAYLRRRSVRVREVVDRDGDTWVEFQDCASGMHFFWCSALTKYSFDPPEPAIPHSRDLELKARLKEGDLVAFVFGGDEVPVTAEVLRVRETVESGGDAAGDAAGDASVVSVRYDVRECGSVGSGLTSPRSISSTLAGGSVGPGSLLGGGGSTNSSEGIVGGSSACEGADSSSGSKGGELRVQRWVPRELLTRAPKSAEEIALDDKETEWRNELARTKVRRAKELARREEERYRAEKLRKRGPVGAVVTRRERGRTALQEAERSRRRSEAEKALRQEQAKRALAESEKRSQEVQAAKLAEKKQRAKIMRKKHKMSSPSSSPRDNASGDVRRHGGKIPAPAADAPPARDCAVKAKKRGPLAAGVEAEREHVDGRRSDHEGADRDQVEGTKAELKYEARRKALEDSLRIAEDRLTTPRTVDRRGLIRMVQMAMVRQASGFVVCEWGCRTWVRLGQDKFFHETERCAKRILPCELGCGLRMRHEEWLSPSEGKAGVSTQQYHEEEECSMRLVPCGLRCGEWLHFKDKQHHMKVLCIKRPFPPIMCHLGCGEGFEGGLHRMLQSEEERIEHEHELCPHRLMHCTWEGCEEMVMEKDRRAHHEEHVTATGVFLFCVPGTYSFKVPTSCRCLKIQAWGAGGGSGHFRGGTHGDGGGGAFAEAIFHVIPDEELEITVGGGGSAGVYGGSMEVSAGFDSCGKPVTDLIDQCGVAEGGWPGGGAGHGGNSHWAAGAGGGYSLVARKVESIGGTRTEPLLVVGAGGGGGSRHGVPGGGLSGEIPGTKVDLRNGRMGVFDSGGKAGDSGDVVGCAFPPQAGDAWRGGAGGQYGGGGGSGWYGGGGGGTAPGIVGGGGGGSCYVNASLVMDMVVLQGTGRIPGGMDRAPPRARGTLEDDIVGGVCGEGGLSGPFSLRPGNHGAVRIHKPGFFDKQLERN